jgi:hypothetical protein
LDGPRLIDCLLQYPASDLAREIFSSFFNNLTQQGTFDTPEAVPLATYVDLQHILQSVELDSGPLNEQKPGIQGGEAEDCLDVKIKINFDRWDQSPSCVIGEKVHHFKMVPVIQLNTVWGYLRFLYRMVPFCLVFRPAIFELPSLHRINQRFKSRFTEYESGS